MKEFFFTLSRRLHVSATPASTSLLIMHSTVFSIHSLKPVLVLFAPHPCHPSSLSSNAGTGFHMSTLLAWRVGVCLPPPCVSPNASGWGVRLWRLCQMGKHQENQCLSSLMLLLLPTVLRIDCVNPRRRYQRLSSCSHSNLWSVLEVSFHLLATLLLLSYF